MSLRIIDNEPIAQVSNVKEEYYANSEEIDVVDNILCWQ